MKTEYRFAVMTRAHADSIGQVMQVFSGLEKYKALSDAKTYVRELELGLHTKYYFEVYIMDVSVNVNYQELYSETKPKENNWIENAVFLFGLFLPLAIVIRCYFYHFILVSYVAGFLFCLTRETLEKIIKDGQ